MRTRRFPTVFGGLLLTSFVFCGAVYAQSETPPPENTDLKITISPETSLQDIRAAVPLGAAMEGFEVLDSQARVLSYVAFTDAEVGGMVFVNRKLYGTISPRDAQAFYSCRGYVTAMNRHWAQDAADWANSLLRASNEVTDKMQIAISTSSSAQSLQEIMKTNPLVDQVKSLASMGSNPLEIFKTLDNLNDNRQARERFAQTLAGLSKIRVGDGEKSVADVMPPEEMAFTSKGIVMAYPSHLLDFFVGDGVVKVMQRPSFNYLARTHMTLFYVPNARWDRCSPSSWRDAFSRLPADEQAQRKMSEETTETRPKARNPNLGAGWWTFPISKPPGAMDINPESNLETPNLR